VELAVQDLIDLVNNPSASGASQASVNPNPEAVLELIQHYNRLMYHAILAAMKHSFNMIKSRVGKDNSGSGGIVAAINKFDLTPFFQVGVNSINQLGPDSNPIELTTQSN